MFPRISAFSFWFEAPLSWGLRIKRDSNSLEGAVAVAPSDQLLGLIYVMWGSLQSVRKYSPSMQATQGVEMVKQSGRWKGADFGKVSWTRGIVGSHDAFGYELPGLRRSRLNAALESREVPYLVKAFYAHCEKSARYFVIVGELKESEFENSNEIYQNIVRSFSCHDVAEGPVSGFLDQGTELRDV